MAYRALEKLINLENGYRRVFRIDDLELLLFQEFDQRALIARRCPHADQVLDTALVRKGIITCPAHQISFSLSDGCATGGECSALRVHELVYEGNSVGFDE
ncbi:MAG: nitrite reductase/ring-hydroxylating ferredoxin subunit [Halieaceae bacterium]|jgi:nitrite reductase/ring-hydroxylating ferredoxin subunit